MLSKHDRIDLTLGRGVVLQNGGDLGVRLNDPGIAKRDVFSGLIHGTRKTFLPSGEPLTFEQWQHGAANGVTVVYEQGEKVAEVPYVNGQKNGLECRFVNEVAIVEEIHWQDDMRHGPSIRYVEGQSFTDWYLNDSKVTKAYYDQRIGPNSR